MRTKDLFLWWPPSFVKWILSLKKQRGNFSENRLSFTCLVIPDTLVTPSVSQAQSLL